MMRVLVLHYSQTGQLTRAAKSMMAPLEQAEGVEVVWQALEPVEPYPFPWPFLRFFDTFPECVYLDPPPIKPVAPADPGAFDLVVIAYQVWFLSPASPIVAFLQSDGAREVLQGKPVVTLIACRNMWLSAQQTMKRILGDLGARLVDNVVLVDQGPPWATFITTPWWMLTGKKDSFRGIFPPAGVSEEDIDGAQRFGRALVDAIPKIEAGDPGPFLSGLGAVTVFPGYISGERLAHRSFRIWGKLLRSIGRPGQLPRRLVLVIYILFLVSLILTVMPLGIVVRAMLRPFMRERLEAQVKELEAPSGSTTERLASYK